MFRSMPQVVILGVGNLMRSDEGIGVHVLVALEQRYEFPGNVRFLDGSVPTQDLLSHIADVDELIVLEAASSSGPEVVMLEGASATAAFTSGTLPHHRGVADLLATLAVLGRSPRRVLLVGVQPVVRALDLRLSPTVEARVGALCEEVVVELSALGLPPTRRAPVLA